MKAFEVERDVVEASGPDASSFLQGQLSQDLDRLGVGESAWSFLLQPQGKVEALLRITRPDGDRWLLDVDGGYGEAASARLTRFKLRVKCDLELLTWRCVALRDGTTDSLGAVVAAARWPSHDGVDLLGPDVESPAGVDVGSADEYEELRIEAGWPKMGAELTEKTIPAETGIVDLAVSFTKGCYTGQELVARIDSRGGNVPRHLRGVVFESDLGVPSGARLERDGKQVGSLTSVSGSVALGYVGREVEPPAEVTVAWDTETASARVVSLPIT